MCSKLSILQKIFHIVIRTSRKLPLSFLATSPFALGAPPSKMQLLEFSKLALLLFESSIVDALANHSTYPPDAVDLLASEGLGKLAAYQAENYPKSKCTLENAIERREWFGHGFS